MTATIAPPAQAAGARRSRRTRPRAGRGGQAWPFVAPALLLVTVFFVVPLAGTVWTSLHKWPLYGEPTFTGIANYRSAMHDTVFWSSIGFTVKFTLVTTVLGVLASFGLALLIRVPRPGVGLFRTAYFLPVTVGYAVAGFLWFYLYDGTIGVVNDVLTRLGVIDHPVQWLAEVRTSFWAIVLMSLWKSVGFGMVILMIGMQAVPKELYEAFAVDGASRWQTVRRLTIPLLRDSFALVTILALVVGMLSFDQFYAMTRGGPNGQTVTAVYAIFLNAFDYQKLGYGSALAVILLLLLALVSVAQLAVFRRRS